MLTVNDFPPSFREEEGVEENQREFLYLCKEKGKETLMKATKNGVKKVEKTKELIGLKIPIYHLMAGRLYRHENFAEIV